MDFSGEFKIAGHPQDVIVKFTDVERMASCMPGVSLEGQDEEGNYLGSILVSFGPKRIKFNGKVSCEFDIPNCSGTLRGRGAANLRAARVEVETRFTVRADETADPASPASVVSIDSKSKLGGVIAEFAQTGGMALANVLMKKFAENLAEEFSRNAPIPGPREAKALSAHSLVWSALKSKFGSS